MKKHLLIYFCIITLILAITFLFPIIIKAQTIPVGSFREEQVRIQQLFNDSLSNSFSNRPVWKKTYDTYFKGKEENSSWWNRPHDFLHWNYMNDEIKVGIYEPVLSNTINTKFPHGGNNGAAWYGRGLTSEFQGGFFITSDYVTLTFRPHLIYTQNRAFKVPRFVPRDEQGNVLYGHKELGFAFDNPFRFGPDPYTDFDLAQSSIRLHYKGVEAGLSNAPLWWGPGIQNALVMSNNAAGLQHAFLGTRYPIKLPLNIGWFEFKGIWAWPVDSKYYQNIESTMPRRFMGGTHIVYTPSFAPHLSIGFTKIFHQYVPEGGLDFSNYFEIFRLANRQPASGDGSQNQLFSVYFRWAFPESHAEIYAEYFREDSFADMRDLFLEPDHDRAYTLGFQKIIPTQWIDFVKVNLEINSLVPNRTDEVRRQTYYYTHARIKEGHTNRGQILGAAIGTGSSSQFLGVDGYFEKGKAGFFIQRVVDNNYFHYEFNQRYVFPLSTESKDYFNHLVDLNIGLNGSYMAGPILLEGRLIWTKTFNYGRYNLGDRGRPTENLNADDLINLQFAVSVRYLF